MEYDDCILNMTEYISGCKFNQLLIQPSCVPLPLSDDVLKEIVPAAKDFALLNGAGMRYRGRYNPEILEMAPFFLFPSPFPGRDFEFVKELQPHINLLMHKIAHDYDFLHSCLKNTIQVDDFTARLWKIYETVRKEGISQCISLGVFRCDYFYCTLSRSVILFVVEDVTYNICDQRFHEYEIRNQRPEIHVIRRNLTQIGNTAKLTEDKRLIVDDMEIAVVYFRCGYEPNQYPTETEWEARLTIERSKAIKCPSIYYHLAGAKKVQQEMAAPGVLEKYLDPAVAKKVARLFTGLYSLDKGDSGDRAIEMALTSPQNFVLKPQREGGGNNIYGEEIAEVLEKIRDSPEREAFILMDRIRPPVQRNYLLS
ncbi:Glutathione synthetase [Armadillidium nasatum]|uniref:Glutathione synthetase n=1 Tax=Armadillidium nasatum TaxID=96803 RepID=A0A5N5SXP1_9CRUS|nr:Glutathione synthetase [Armadillidium nasatum]